MLRSGGDDDDDDDAVAVQRQRQLRRRLRTASLERERERERSETASPAQGGDGYCNSRGGLKQMRASARVDDDGDDVRVVLAGGSSALASDQVAAAGRKRWLDSPV